MSEKRFEVKELFDYDLKEDITIEEILPDGERRDVGVLRLNIPPRPIQGFETDTTSDSTHTFSG